jgi:signal transduction histidine kinase/ligand-binding sensor domain-containing protein
MSAGPNSNIKYPDFVVNMPDSLPVYNYFRYYIAKAIRIFSILVCCTISLVNAQDFKFAFDQINSKQGLSHNTVTTITKDHRGLMWIGTEKGLNCYNGYSIKVYEKNSKDTSSISSNRINCLFEDSKERLWVGTITGGLNLYNRNTDSFLSFMHRENDSNSIAGNNIEFIVEDSKGNIWIGDQEAGLSLIPTDTNGLISFKTFTQRKEKNVPGSNNLTFLHEDKNYNIWIGTRDAGVYKAVEVSKGNYQFNYYPLNNGSEAGEYQQLITSVFEDSEGIIWFGSDVTGLTAVVPQIEGPDSIIHYLKNSSNNRNSISPSVSVIFEDSKKNIWIGSWDSGLYLFNKKENKFFHFKHDRNDKKSIAGTTIVSITEDNSGNLWVGSGGSGISMLNWNDSTFINYFSNETENNISSNLINCIYKDDQSNLWIGTRAGGVNLLNSFKAPFRHFKHSATDLSTIRNNVVLSFLEDNNNNVWVGTDGGGVSVFSPEMEFIQHFQYDERTNNSISHNVVLSLLQDSLNNVWLGTWTGGLNKLDLETNKFSLYDNIPQDLTSLSNPNVWVLNETSSGEFLVGTCCNGLNLMNRKTGKFYHFTTDEEDSTSIAGNCIWSVYEDKRNNLWIGTASGLSKRVGDGRDGPYSFINYYPSNKDKHSISSEWIWCAYEDSDSNLWFGTNGGGLNMLNRDNDQFISYTEDDGLPDNVIYGILEDDNKNLWLSTNNGLCRFNPQNKEIKVFDSENGLHNNQFKSNAYLKLKNGYMLFGGINGFYAFHPDSLKDNTLKPPILITNFEIFNKPVTLEQDNSPLKKQISETSEIVLTHKQSSFSFKFVALNYIFPEKNEYAYFLEGFEPTWNYSKHKRTASYTNIDPGRYVFRVKAANNDGVWNQTGTAIYITITPPFWQTIWFRFIASIVVILIVLSIHFARIRNISRQKRMLKLLVDKRTEELTWAKAEQDKLIHKLSKSNDLLRERQNQIKKQSSAIKKQRDELFEANSVKDKLFSIIAHDLKNPFNSILGSSELLSLNYFELDDENRRQLIQHLNESAERVYNLLENLLSWSRAQQGRIVFSPTTHNITKIIEENIELAHTQAAKKNISIKLISNNGNVVGFIDKDLINTVVRNLLTNAIKFSRVNGEITVTIVLQTDKTAISIKDEGVGISEENVKKIFDKNINFSTFGTSNESGTGLGLIICQDFIHKHGGEIWVESQEGKGSEFTFTIPDTPVN